MKTSIYNESRLYAGVLSVGIFISALGFPPAAFAALGGSVESVQNDQARLAAKLKTTPANAYTVYELTEPFGTIVREYVSVSGQVFAVTWRGPFVPDMKQLLGGYFEQYSLAAKGQTASRSRGLPLDIREPHLVVQAAGHMRAYSGRAYDPALLPLGVGAHDVQ